MSILERGYIEVPKLVQKYLKQLSWLERRLRQSRPKEGAPNAEWMASFAKATKLMCDLQREDRQTKAASRAEELSDTELIKELEPILIKSGWRAPKKDTP